jgi:hypothetical protein
MAQTSYRPRSRLRNVKKTGVLIRSKGAAAAVVSLGVGAPLQAQWHAILLHPSQAQYSAVSAVFGREAGGIATFAVSQATVWDWTNGTTGTLAPPPETSQINGMWADQRVGLWAGSATIWSGGGATSLHPAGVGYSEALSVRDGMQVGYSAMPNPKHAAVWWGTAQSYVDLNPAAAVRSEARATDGTFQGGWATFHGPSGDVQHAALWNGSAASFVDFNPPQAIESMINGMAPGEQVGYTQVLGGQRLAAVWSGTAQSLVSLHPPGVGGDSVLNATTGSVQVGELSISVTHAAIWFGSASSFLDLHQFLPPGYGSSEARAVFQDGGTIVVGGVALRNGFPQAVVWVGTIPGPPVVAPLGWAAVIAARRRR